MNSLAAFLGITNRHLNRLVRNELGFGPKKFLQIFRFSQALGYMHLRDKISLAEVAYRFGYYDQAHFSHEFKSLAGYSPREYLRNMGKIEYLDIGEKLPHMEMKYLRKDK